MNTVNVRFHAQSFFYVEIRSNTRSFIAQLRYLSRDILAQISINRPFNNSLDELGRTQCYWLTIWINGALFLTLIFDQIQCDIWDTVLSKSKIIIYTVSVLHKNSQSPLSNKQTSRSLQIKNAWPLHSKNKQNNQKNKNSVQQIFFELLRKQ